MVMSVDMGRFPMIQTNIFFTLMAENVMKVSSKGWMIKEETVFVFLQKCSNALLTFKQFVRYSRLIKFSGKIEVQSRIKTVFESQLSSPLGILHKNHGAHRGNPAIFEANHAIVCSSSVLAPVIRVNDEHIRTRSREIMGCAVTGRAEPSVNTLEI
jgi:hypothetical protein